MQRILIVDGSKVVRATLAKHLKGDYELLEEGDGESAWQALMLNASIDLVISGVNPPRLGAIDLLERLKSSAMRRLRDMPFVLVVSDIDSHPDLESDQAKGVTGYLTKTMSKTEMLSRLTSWLSAAALPDEVPVKEAAVPVFVAPASPPPPEAPTSSTSHVVEGGHKAQEGAPRPAAKTPALLSHSAFIAALTSESLPDPKESPVSTLVFVIDNYAQLHLNFGDKVAAKLKDKLFRMVASKVDPSDVMGQCGGERIAIVSRGVDLKHCVRFARRVCRSLAAGQIMVLGKPVKLTCSVGVASTSDDTAASFPALLDLAERRLDQVLQCGGNAVASDYRPGCPLSFQSEGIRLLMAALGSKQSQEALTQKIGQIGEAILPVIDVMNKELRLYLPMDEIREKLAMRYEKEQKLGDKDDRIDAALTPSADAEALSIGIHPRTFTAAAAPVDELDSVDVDIMEMSDVHGLETEVLSDGVTPEFTTFHK